MTGVTTNDSPSTTTAEEVVAVGVTIVAVGVVIVAVATVTVLVTAALLTDSARAAPATSTSRPSQDSIGVTASGSCAGLGGGAVPKMPGTEVSAALGAAAETTVGIVGRTDSSGMALANAAGLRERRSDSVVDGVRADALAITALTGFRRGPVEPDRPSEFRETAVPDAADAPAVGG